MPTVPYWKKSNIHSFLIGGLLIGSLSGCRIMHQPEPTPIVSTPESYAGNADSSGIGEQPFRILFTDPNVLLGRFPQPIRRGASIRDQQLPLSVQAGIPAQLVRRRPDIRQAERELEAANVDVAVAQADFLPSLNLTPYLGLNAFRPSVLLNPLSLASGVLGSLAAPVFNRRLLKGNLTISQAQSREAYFAYQRAILTGVSEVVSSLKGLENYRTVADLQAQEVAVLRQAVTTSNDLFAASYATYLEVITAQRSVLDAELALINTTQAQFISLVELYRALGGGWQ